MKQTSPLKAGRWAWIKAADVKVDPAFAAAFSDAEPVPVRPPAGCIAPPAVVPALDPQMLAERADWITF